MNLLFYLICEYLRNNYIRPNYPTRTLTKQIYHNRDVKIKNLREPYFDTEISSADDVLNLPRNKH